MEAGGSVRHHYGKRGAAGALGDEMARIIITVMTLFFASVFVSAGMAVAAPIEETVVAQLNEQGYSNISVRRSFLGRILITATSDAGQREIVINPNTGEILRDYFQTGRKLADKAEGGGSRAKGDGGAAALTGGEETGGVGDAPVQKSGPSIIDTKDVDHSKPDLK